MILLSAVSCIVLALTVVFLATVLTRYRKRCDVLQAQVDRFRGEATQRDIDLLQRNEMDSVKDEFISTVSHELRTPLTSIRGALGLLSAGLMGKVDDKAANLLRIASTNTDRLVRLINDILDLERMSSGAAPLQPRQCSMRDLVLQAIDTMGAMAQGAHVQLQIVPEPGNPPSLCEADPDRIQQVLTNLFSNAIKFSPAGAVVCVRIETHPGELLIRVEDRGRGVPATKLESIFDRFQQVDPSDSRQKGGTGLGLAICRSIIHQHGGRIWAERNDASRHGIPGTTFMVRLPRPDQGLPAPPPQRAQATILVVDDDPGIRQVVAERVRNQGYAVLEAESGQNALLMASAQSVEAILLDLCMPGLTGWKTIEKLKANPITAEIPVVALNVISPGTRKGGRTPLIGKAQGWLQKPSNPSLLLAELSRVLHHGAGPARIVLVEDDADLAAVVLASFNGTPGQASDVQIAHATSLAEAKDMCERHEPALLILDLNLPDSSAFALVNWLRCHAHLGNLPLVVYSGREVTAAERQQLRLGPTQFLTKASVQPKEVEELVFAMIRHLQTPTPGAIST